MTFHGSPSRIVIWGATGHAKVVREALGARAGDVCAVFDRRHVEPPFDDVPLHIGEPGFQEWLTTTNSPETVEFVVAIGGPHGRERMEVHRTLADAGLRPLKFSHERAFVAASASCAAGSQVLALAAVCAEAEIGIESIVNTSATVDHECRVGDGVHLGPGSHLAGLVEVGDFAFVGAGAVVLPRVRIGADAIIGAGSVVLHDIRPGATVVGNPARELRDDR